MLKHHFTPTNYFLPSWESSLLMVPTPLFTPSPAKVVGFVYLNPRGTGTNSAIPSPSAKEEALSPSMLPLDVSTRDHQRNSGLSRLQAVLK